MPVRDKRMSPRTRSHRQGQVRTRVHTGPRHPLVVFGGTLLNIDPQQSSKDGWSCVAPRSGGSCIGADRNVAHRSCRQTAPATALASRRLFP